MLHGCERLVEMCGDNPSNTRPSTLNECGFIKCVYISTDSSSASDPLCVTISFVDGENFTQRKNTINDIISETDYYISRVDEGCGVELHKLPTSKYNNHIHPTEDESIPTSTEVDRNTHPKGGELHTAEQETGEWCIEQQNQQDLVDSLSEGEIQFQSPTEDSFSSLFTKQYTTWLQVIRLLLHSTNTNGDGSGGIGSTNPAIETFYEKATSKSNDDIVSIVVEPGINPIKRVTTHGYQESVGTKNNQFTISIPIDESYSKKDIAELLLIMLQQEEEQIKQFLSDIERT